MRAVTGVVQHYDWGDPDTLPALLGHPPDGRPWAEWWLGTHPNGPSTLGDGRPLTTVSGELPYLLKVLAVARPLSLQAHPSAAQAADGHRRGVYQDPNAKPELLCALTRFEALCGFRDPADSAALLASLGPGAARIASVAASDGPAAVLDGLLRGTLDPAPVVAACHGAPGPEAATVAELAHRHPGDPAVAATLLLNRVTLEPGDWISLAPGNLHAYLRGTGVELMGASDNVVRCGLTSKSVDVDELLRIVDPTPTAHPVRSPARLHPLGDEGIALLRIDAGARYEATSAGLALDLDGHAWYVDAGDTLTAAATTFAVVRLADQTAVDAGR